MGKHRSASGASPRTDIGSRSRARHEFDPLRQTICIRHCAIFDPTILILSPQFRFGGTVPKPSNLPDVLLVNEPDSIISFNRKIMHDRGVFHGVPHPTPNSTLPRQLENDPSPKRCMAMGCKLYVVHVVIITILIDVKVGLGFPPNWGRAANIPTAHRSLCRPTAYLLLYVILI